MSNRLIAAYALPVIALGLPALLVVLMSVLLREIFPDVRPEAWYALAVFVYIVLVWLNVVRFVRPLLNKWLEEDN